MSREIHQPEHCFFARGRPRGIQVRSIFSFHFCGMLHIYGELPLIDTPFYQKRPGLLWKDFRASWQYCEKSCKGRNRTSTEQLAIAHRINLVVNPLSYVYPELSTPETGGHVCQFHHLTVSKFQLYPVWINTKVDKKSNL